MYLIEVKNRIKMKNHSIYKNLMMSLIVVATYSAQATLVKELTGSSNHC